MCRLNFAGKQVYVAASQFKRRQHHHRQAQRLEALRARGIAEKAWAMEGRQQSYRPSQNETGRLIAEVIR